MRSSRIKFENSILCPLSPARAAHRTNPFIRRVRYVTCFALRTFDTNVCLPAYTALTHASNLLLSRLHHTQHVHHNFDARNHFSSETT